MTRLHLLFGESNQNEFAYAPKVGTTSIVLRLLEDGLVPPTLTLAQPLVALREVSRDPGFRWLVTFSDGGTIPAVDLQRRYLELAQGAYQGESEQTDWVLSSWESVLDGLERTLSHDGGPHRLGREAEDRGELRGVGGRGLGRGCPPLRRPGVPQHRPRKEPLSRPPGDGPDRACWTRWTSSPR